MTKIAAGLHAALAVAAIYYAMRMNNDVSFSEVSGKELLVMLGIVVLPGLSAWAGLRIARSDAARRLLAIGQTAAFVLFAATFVAVVRSAEGMAPLLFMLVSMWIAAGLAVLLAIVRFMGRSARV